MFSPNRARRFQELQNPTLSAPKCKPMHNTTKQQRNSHNVLPQRQPHSALGYNDPLQFLIPLKILGSFNLILLISLLGMLTTSSAERSQPSSLQSSDSVQSHNSHTWLLWNMAQSDFQLQKPTPSLSHHQPQKSQTNTRDSLGAKLSSTIQNLYHHLPKIQQEKFQD